MKKSIKRVLLGVNVDHVATVRQVRLARAPDPVMAALLAEQSGADSITMHLREDRRHIQENDVLRARQTIATRLNLEIAPTDEMTAFALDVRPASVCIVPEKREELTTEGGLDVQAHNKQLSAIVPALAEQGIQVSLFVDPQKEILDAVCELGAPQVELHTGEYANARATLQHELTRIADAVDHALELGLQVNAGHGLDYHNTYAIASLRGISELNIGHAIVSRAVFTGWSEAVREMRQVINIASGTTQ